MCVSVKKFQHPSCFSMVSKEKKADDSGQLIFLLWRGETGIFRCDNKPDL